MLWFNMITFTLMIASLGLSYLIYRKYRSSWLKDYLIYTLTYAIWLLFATYTFFQTAFLPAPVSWLESGFIYARAGVSIFIAFFGFRFFLKTAGYGVNRFFHAAVWGFTLLILIMITIALVFTRSVIGSLSTKLFNAFFFLFSLLSFLRVRKAAGLVRMMIPFLIYSAVSYFILLAAGIILPAIIPANETFRINVLAVGIYCFVWGIIIIIIFMQRITVQQEDSNFSHNFFKDYSITPREAEIVRFLFSGNSGKKISEQLFISQRTVETHCYNIYRKCNVKNRMELINLIRRYSS